MSMKTPAVMAAGVFIEKGTGKRGTREQGTGMASLFTFFCK